MKTTRRALLTLLCLAPFALVSGQVLAAKNRAQTTNVTLPEFVSNLNFITLDKEPGTGAIAFSGTPFLDVALVPPATPSQPANSTSSIVLPSTAATPFGYMTLFFLIAISIAGTAAYRFHHWFHLSNISTLRLAEFFHLAARQKPQQAAEPQLEQPFVLSEADYQNFQLLLEKIQLARGQADLNRLSQCVTENLLFDLNDELIDNTSRGLVYKTNQLRMSGAELIRATQTLDENIAEVFLKWQAIDYMARLDRQSGVTDYVASGNSVRPADLQEIWTFTCLRPNGRWVLAARQTVTLADLREQQVA